MRELFSKELEDRSPAARAAIARRLLDEAAKIQDAPADQFVVLSGAIRAATEAGDLRLAFEVVDKIAGAFEVDGLAVKANVALKMSPKGYAANVAENVPTALELLDPLESAEEFAVASRLVAILQQASAGDPWLRASVPKRAKQVEELRSARDRLGPALEKLKTSPEDPAANLAVGRYTALMRGDWDRGLPFLQKGNDPKLQSLARHEMASPADAAGRAQLADECWAAAERESPAIKAALQRRAAYWYGQAVPGLSGLAKIAADKRIAEANASGGTKPGVAHDATAGGLELTAVAAVDGHFEVVEDGGVKLLRGTADSHGNYDPHIYFTVGDHPGAFRGPVFLWLTYRDLGHGSIGVEYNADGENDKRASVTAGGTLTDDGRTKMAVFRLDAPNFRHAENGGADLRVMRPGGKTPLCIERAALYRHVPPP